MVLSLLAAPAMAQTEASAPAPQQQAPYPIAGAAEPTQIIITGRRPGPGLWKITKGDHVMWVFGTYSPLPQKMEWYSERVERLIAQSQEVILPPTTRAPFSLLGFLKAIPQLPELQMRADGAKLRDVVPPHVYARWLVLKEKYIGQNDRIEAYRPYFAAEDLVEAGLKKAGLSTRNEVTEAITAIAKKNRLKLTSVAVEVDRVRAFKDFKEAQVDDVPCFTETLERLDDRIDAMRVRAQAWAKGDIAEISSLDYGEHEQACRAVWEKGTANALDMQAVRKRLRETWIDSAEKALAENNSTFAVLGMSWIFNQAGVMTALRAKGYTVDRLR
jgi:uncharacterized protein YbaP (TraB family)